MADSILTPYTGDATGRERRLRNALYGMDELLRTACDTHHEITAAEDRLVRQTTHRYRKALSAINKEMKTAAPRNEHVLELARTALAQLPADEPEDNSPHTSVRMCQWMSWDFFIYLARILDADAEAQSLGEDSAEKILAVTRKIIARAYAPITMR